MCVGGGVGVGTNRGCRWLESERCEGGHELLDGALARRGSEPGVNVGVSDEGCTADDIMSFRGSRVKWDECSVSGRQEAVSWR